MSRFLVLPLYLCYYSYTSIFNYITYTDYVGCNIEVCVVFKIEIAYIQAAELCT
jgi:hypothetical protein